jgi:methylmalonyl-CoA/ethylmalonyl-CoA epimerase
VLRGEPHVPAAAASTNGTEGADAAEPVVRETQTPVLELPPTAEELARRLSVKKLHHVAVAVDSVDEALRFYRDVLGLNDITTMTLEDRGLKIGLVKAGVSEIELLEPTNPENTVQRFLDRRGPGLHHVCFEVDDVEASMRHFEGRGAEFIDPVPRPGAVGLVSFMPPSVADGVLVELAQTSGYTLPSAEPAEDETATVPAEKPITQPYIRSAGAVAYARHGLWTPPPQPEPTSSLAPPDTLVEKPITKPYIRSAGAVAYARHGLWSSPAHPPVVTSPPPPDDAPSPSDDPPFSEAVPSPSDAEPVPSESTAQSVGDRPADDHS